MPAIIARDAMATIAKRNWAAEEPGVITVFCIVGVVGIGLIALFISKKLAARRERKASQI